MTVPWQTRCGDRRPHRRHRRSTGQSAKSCRLDSRCNRAFHRRTSPHRCPIRSLPGLQPTAQRQRAESRTVRQVRMWPVLPVVRWGQSAAAQPRNRHPVRRRPRINKPLPTRSQLLMPMPIRLPESNAAADRPACQNKSECGALSGSCIRHS